MAVTIRQVAKHAGVSVATVSYVLNNDRRITAETRERVMASVKALNYHPNSMARSLARRQTDVIGLLVPRPRFISDPFLLELISGIGDVASSMNVGLLLLPAAGQGNPIPPQVLQGAVDGVILLESEAHDPRVTLLREQSIPFVLFGRCLDDSAVHWIDVDNVTGASAAVQHLAQLGHKQIAFISAPLKYMFAEFRREGYAQGLAASGLPLEPELIAEGDLSQESGYQAAQHLLRQAPRPTAILAASDMMAIGALRAIKEAGLRVPEDVALVGFDGTQHSAYTEPPLTTVRQPAYDIGTLAAEMLLGIIRGQEQVQSPRIIDPVLVVRQSSGAALLSSK